MKKQIVKIIDNITGVIIELETSNYKQALRRAEEERRQYNNDAKLLLQKDCISIISADNNHKTCVKLEPGLQFEHKTDKESFRIEKYDFYDDGNPILVAVKDPCIYRLDDILLDNYMPIINGVHINEEVEYI